MGKVRLNEDSEVVATVKEGLKRTGGYCPCRLERKPEYKCICEEFKAQIQDPDFEGYCHCRLYYKEKNADTVKAMRQSFALQSIDRACNG